MPQPVMVSPQRANTGTLMLYAYKSFEDDLFARMHAAGHRDLRPKHGAVIANIEGEGTRLTTLARRAGMGTPAMLQLVDELEHAGYVRRRPDPSDRRAKLVVPTRKGVEAVHTSYRIIEEIEGRYEGLLGAKQYAGLQEALEMICGIDAPNEPGRT